MVNGYVEPGFVDTGYVEEGSGSSGLPYVAPTTHSTDFREYRRGRRPEDWTPQFTIPGVKDIDFLVDGAYYDLPHRNYVQIVPLVLGDRALSFNRPNGDAGTNNQEVLTCQRMRSRTTASETFLRVLLRGSGVTGAANYYLFTAGVTGATTVGIYKSISGVLSSISTVVKSYKDGAWIWMRCRANGTTLSLRTWQDGEVEPVSWDVTATGQTDLTTGWVGLHARQTGHKTDVRYFAVGTGGSSAPLESEIESPFDQWATQEDIDVDFSIRLERYNPSIGDVEVKWYSRYGRNTGPTDYPANTHMPPLILDPGTLTSRLEADAQFGGSAIPSRDQMRFDNRPTKQSGSGPMDDYISCSITGRPIEIRIGKVWKVKPSIDNPNGLRMPHYRYEMVGCALATQEMIVTPEEGSVQLGPPSTILQERVPARRNIGISTGFKSLSSSGWLSIPSHLSYNRSDFIIALRVLIPTSGVSGSTFSVLSRRQIDATHRQWHILLYNASHATFPNRVHFLSDQANGTPLVSLVTNKQYNLGRFIDIVFGIGAEWFAWIDQEYVGGGTLSASPGIATSSITEVGRLGIGLSVCDHRIEKYLSPDESLSRFSERRSPDSNNISMHRCDDAGGSTVTDYNTITVNSGTLQGTDAIDRSWVPTYLGSPELTGSPMPISGGVLFNIPTQPIDSLREQFRYNDRDETVGSIVKVKAKGLLLTGGGVSYSEPTEGPGVIDIVGASDQPITVGLAVSTGVENPALQLPKLLRDEMIDRGAFTPENSDSSSFDALRKVLPLKGGFHYPEPPIISEFLQNNIGNIASHLTLDRDGRVSVGCVLPTINPGPYGQDKLVEWTGLSDSGVTLSDHSSYRLTQSTGHFGLLCWFKLTRKMLPDRSVSSTGDYSQPGYTLIDKMDGGTTGYYLGFDGDTGALRFAAGGIDFGGGLHYRTLGDYTLWPVDIWCAVSAMVDGAGYTYIDVSAMPINGVANIIASTGVSFIPGGTLTDSPGIPIRIGHGPMGSFVGSICHVIGSSPRQEPGFNPLVPSINESSLGTIRFRLPLNEGKADRVTEIIQSRTALISGVRWCPRLTLNYIVHPNLSGSKGMTNAWRVDSRYGSNRQPLVGANVAASVSASERIAIGEDYLSSHYTNRTRKENYHNSADLVINTPLTTQEESDLIKFLILQRIEGERRGADVINWTKEALRLSLGDEVLLHNDRWIYDRPMRVAALVAALGQLKGDIGLWG